MQKCIDCGSENLKKLGMRFLGKERGRGFECVDCGNKFTVSVSDLIEDIDAPSPVSQQDLFFIRDEEYLDNLRQYRKFVFVCAVNNTQISEKFFGALQSYCKETYAKLIVLPIRYKNPSLLRDNTEVWYDSRIVPYLVENNFDLLSNVRILGGIKVQATAENPLSGVEGLSKGSTIIVPHPQVALKTLARQIEKYPAIATTTGAITEKNYSSTKAGFKAGFNHSFSAVVVEFSYDNIDEYFIRHLNFDGTGFYDLDGYYDENGASYQNQIDAIVLGDSHVRFHDTEVYNATYKNHDSILKVLRPETLVRHDVLDFYSRSHHSRSDVFTNYAKFHDRVYGNVKSELDDVVQFIRDTTPFGSTNIIVKSNHHNHLRRWLNETDPRQDPENALLYHELMFKVLKGTYATSSGIYSPDPFKVYCFERLQDIECVFLSGRDSYKIFGIEVGLHGDIAANGQRGSSKAFSNVPMKTITAHQHSVFIDKGNYCVGTSSIFNMPYTKGLSSWDHAHCIIHKNGKRQLIFIRNGRWRAERDD